MPAKKLPVVLEDFLHLQGGQWAALVGQQHRVPFGDALFLPLGGIHIEQNGDAPDVARRQCHRTGHRVQVGPPHEPFQRRKEPVGDIHAFPGHLIPHRQPHVVPGRRLRPLCCSGDRRQPGSLGGGEWGTPSAVLRSDPFHQHPAVRRQTVVYFRPGLSHTAPSKIANIIPRPTTLRQNPPFWVTVQTWWVESVESRWEAVSLSVSNQDSSPIFDLQTLGSPQV